MPEHVFTRIDLAEDLNTLDSCVLFLKKEKERK